MSTNKKEIHYNPNYNTANEPTILEQTTPQASFSQHDGDDDLLQWLFAELEKENLPQNVVGAINLLERQYKQGHDAARRKIEELNAQLSRLSQGFTPTVDTDETERDTEELDELQRKCEAQAAALEKADNDLRKMDDTLKQMEKNMAEMIKKLEYRDRDLQSTKQQLADVIAKYSDLVERYNNLDGGVTDI